MSKNTIPENRREQTSTGPAILPTHGSTPQPPCCRGCRWAGQVSMVEYDKLVPTCQYLNFGEPPRLVRQGKSFCGFKTAGQPVNSSTTINV